LSFKNFSEENNLGSSFNLLIEKYLQKEKREIFVIDKACIYTKGEIFSIGRRPFGEKNNISIYKRFVDGIFVYPLFIAIDSENNLDLKKKYMWGVWELPIVSGPDRNIKLSFIRMFNNKGERVDIYDSNINIQFLPQDNYINGLNILFDWSSEVLNLKNIKNSFRYKLLLKSYLFQKFFNFVYEYIYSEKNWEDVYQKDLYYGLGRKVYIDNIRVSKIDLSLFAFKNIFFNIEYLIYLDKIKPNTYEQQSIFSLNFNYFPVELFIKYGIVFGKGSNLGIEVKSEF
jgi:hypothetical protein